MYLMSLVLISIYNEIYDIFPNILENILVKKQHLTNEPDEMLIYAKKIDMKSAFFIFYIMFDMLLNLWKIKK
jgi:hypothetical protein